MSPWESSPDSINFFFFHGCDELITHSTPMRRGLLPYSMTFVAYIIIGSEWQVKSLSLQNAKLTSRKQYIYALHML